MAVIERRFEVSEPLASRLRTETAIIQKLARTREIWRPYLAPLNQLNERLEILKNSGLFYPGTTEPQNVTLNAILSAQAEVANLHGLRYRSSRTSSGWEISSEPITNDTQLKGRSRTYLSDLRNSNTKGMAKVDLALLAHVFQIPTTIIETQSLTVFEQHVERVRRGSDLFVNTDTFLSQSACRDIQLSVTERTHWNPALSSRVNQISRGARILDRNAVVQTVRCNQSIVIEANVSNWTREPFSALAFISDESGNRALISTASLTDQSIHYRDGKLVIPPVAVIEDGRMAVVLDTPESHHLTVVASLDDLSELSALDRSLGAKRSAHGVSTEWTDSDHESLRRFLLESAPDRCLILQTEVVVTPTSASTLV